LIIDAVLRRMKEDIDFGKSTMSFYADDGLVENSDPRKLQRDMDEMVGLFAKFGLRANREKTKFMVVRGPQVPVAQNPTVYNRVRSGGQSRNQWKKEKVECGKCGVELTQGSLRRHMVQIHGAERTTYVCPDAEVGGSPLSFSILMGRRGMMIPCPVVGYMGGAGESFSMYRHFAYKHPNVDLIVNKDPLERCQLCKMFTRNVENHGRTQTCKKLQVRRENERDARKQKEAEEVIFRINGEEIERVREFRYLGRILDENDDDSRCILAQLSKARGRWWRMAKILKREGADSFQMGRFYVAVVQAVLLYGSESWTISLREMEALERFQKKAMRYMTGRHIQKDSEGEWHYPEHGEMMRMCGLKPVSHYIRKRRGTLRLYLRKYKMELLKEVEKIGPPARGPNKVLWWRQPWIEKGSGE